MKQIFKILKKHLLSIVFVIVLLFLQANFDLALPDYTADIVNVGIQQNGIEDTTVEVIRKSQMEKLLLFVENKEEILNNYELIETNNKDYLKKYPILEKESVYILKNNTDSDKLNSIMSKPLLLVTMLEQNDNIKQSIIEKMPNISQDTDIFTIFSYMSEQQIKEILKPMQEQFEEIDDNLVYQMNIASIKQEYEEVGVNLKNKQLSYIIITGLKMLGLALLAMIISIITVYFSSKIAASFSRDLRKSIVSKVMSYSNKEFEEFSTASLITRSTNDIQQIQMLIVMLLRVVIYAPILGFGALAKVSGNSMSWIIGLAVLIILSLVIILFSIALPKFKNMQKLIDRLNLVSREILTGLPVIRAFSNEKYEEKRFDEANTNLMKTSLFVNRVMEIMMPTMMFVMNGICVLIVWVGADKIDAGTMQVGTLMAFITYTMQIIMSFLMISMLSIILPRAWVSIKRVGEVFNKESSIKEKETTKKFNKNETGTVEFKDVYFRYPDAEEDVLRNINFKATKGTTTAFIGSTGSGKSTLINLIPRFFDVTGGKILIDGTDIRDVKLKDLRSKIGFVPQKGLLFSGTIESNIKFGDDNLTKEQVKEAAEIAQALEFIEEKEEKFKSPIAQGGTNVSGGQKQRLAIARAIALKPEIYIFDDSFSALDFKTDAKLRKTLNKKLKDSTIFIVAQRISTILNADQIIVIDNGSIVGIGKHEELMKNCDVYKEIALSQLSKEELDNE